MQTFTMQAELYLLAYLWAAFGIYWIGTAVLMRSRSNRAEMPQSRELGFYRPLRLLILATTFSLLFWRRTAVGFLGTRFIPSSAGVSTAGLLLPCSGWQLRFGRVFILVSIGATKSCCRRATG